MILFSHNVENIKGFQDKIAQNRAEVDRLAKGACTVLLISELSSEM